MTLSNCLFMCLCLCMCVCLIIVGKNWHKKISFFILFFLCFKIVSYLVYYLCLSSRKFSLRSPFFFSFLDFCFFIYLAYIYVIMYKRRLLAFVLPSKFTISSLHFASHSLYMATVISNLHFSVCLFVCVFFSLIEQCFSVPLKCMFAIGCYVSLNIVCVCVFFFHFIFNFIDFWIYLSCLFA